MVLSLVKNITTGTLVYSEVNNRQALSSNGDIAREHGVAKPNTQLTVQERKTRTLTSLNPKMLEDRNYAATSAVAFNKIYPEGDNTMTAMRKMLVKSMTIDTDYILADPSRVQFEFFSYIEFCGEERIPVSKGGFVAWLGTTRGEYDRLGNLDSDIALTLQKVSDYIMNVRTAHADEGKIPVVQHIFEAANSHGYSRSDPKTGVNIMFNTNNYSNDEQMRIIDAADMFEDI